MSSASSASQPIKKPYFHNGQPLSSPPLSARIRRFIDSAYVFLGLYLVTLFSIDPFSAASTSQFNVSNRRPGQPRNTSRGTGVGGWFGGGGGGGGSDRKGPGGGGGGSAGGGGKKLGTVNDVRGPECGSCG